MTRCEVTAGSGGSVFIVDTLHLLLVMDTRCIQWNLSPPTPHPSRKNIGMYIHFAEISENPWTHCKNHCLGVKCVCLFKDIRILLDFPWPTRSLLSVTVPRTAHVWVRMTSYSSLQSSTAGGSDLLSKRICPISIIQYYLSIILWNQPGQGNLRMLTPCSRESHL